jgi:RNA-binding protein
MTLTGRQRRHLRALGHELKATLQVGKEGVTEALVGALGQLLKDHELVKVKIGQNSPVERHAAAGELASHSRSEVAQVLGNAVLLYRAGDEPVIVLPGGVAEAGGKKAKRAPRPVNANGPRKTPQEPKRPAFARAGDGTGKPGAGAGKPKRVFVAKGGSARRSIASGGASGGQSKRPYVPPSGGGGGGQSKRPYAPRAVGSARGERSERGERGGRPYAPRGGERSGRPERSERSGRPERGERSGRPERGERSGRPERGDRTGSFRGKPPAGGRGRPPGGGRPSRPTGAGGAGGRPGRSPAGRPPRRTP